MKFRIVLKQLFLLLVVMNAIVLIGQSQTIVPLFDTNNVLAVGIYNDSPTSSDLVGSAEVTDNNGVVYVNGELTTWPAGTDFRYKVVFFDNGTGAEEPGWQQKDFDDSSWTQNTDLGFPIGHGTSSETGKIDILLDPTNETVYTRSTFSVQNIDTISTLTIKVAGDDQAVAWFNGVYIGFAGAAGSDRGESQEDYTFDSSANSGSFGAWDEGDPFAFTGTGTAQFTVQVEKVSSTINWEILK